MIKSPKLVDGKRAHAECTPDVCAQHWAMLQPKVHEHCCNAGLSLPIYMTQHESNGLTVLTEHCCNTGLSLPIYTTQHDSNADLYLYTQLNMTPMV